MKKDCGIFPQSFFAGWVKGTPKHKGQTKFYEILLRRKRGAASRGILTP